jgi:hypothetical protein
MAAYKMYTDTKYTRVYKYVYMYLYTAVHQVISCFPANWIVCYPPLIGYLTDCPTGGGSTTRTHRLVSPFL